jgi:hypothetical protein
MGPTSEVSTVAPAASRLSRVSLVFRVGDRVHGRQAGGGAQRGHERLGVLRPPHHRHDHRDPVVAGGGT